MRARRDGGDYLLSGSKRFITHGSIANIVTIIAATDPEAGGRKGLSAFIVEADSHGFSAPRLEHKMGIRGSPTAELHLDDVRVPVANRLGAEGEGFAVAMATLDRSRLSIAAQAVGIAQGALDFAVGYAAQREQFGERLADMQGIQFMLADMASGVEAARPSPGIGVDTTNCGCQVAPPSVVRRRKPDGCVTSPKRSTTRYPRSALENATPRTRSVPTAGRAV
jgi:alkylation response protein AidB-like acyl-CoA dehydrogenase